MYPLPALLGPLLALVTPFPKMHFTNEEATGAINEAAIVANKEAKNPPSCFITFSVTPSISTPEFFSNFMILIVLLISSVKMNKVNLFPAYTAPHPCIFLSKLSISC